MSEELTREDVRKIEAEIQKRKLEIRPKLIEAVKEARAQSCRKTLNSMPPRKRRIKMNPGFVI